MACLIYAVTFALTLVQIVDCGGDGGVCLSGFNVQEEELHAVFDGLVEGFVVEFGEVELVAEGRLADVVAGGEVRGVWQLLSSHHNLVYS